MTLVIRYFDGTAIKEDFFGFVIVKDMTGEGLSAATMARLDELDIPLENAVGQCYDGASAMAGVNMGVQARIKQHANKAVYVHCSAHTLNLVISSTSKVADVRNACNLVEKIQVLFRNSAKRSETFKRALEACNLQTKKNK